MTWIVHGERMIYESPWVNLALTDIEIPTAPVSITMWCAPPSTQSQSDGRRIIADPPAWERCTLGIRSLGGSQRVDPFVKRTVAILYLADRRDIEDLPNPSKSVGA
ncbi:MAG: hypothetical protein JWM34_3051 [Ilumatobacteraceae bacterium]|nr:hypothetical protein [Ilumatobacteraceae bacterium]